MHSQVLHHISRFAGLSHNDLLHHVLLASILLKWKSHAFFFFFWRHFLTSSTTHTQLQFTTQIHVNPVCGRNHEVSLVTTYVFFLHAAITCNLTAINGQCHKRTEVLYPALTINKTLKKLPLNKLYPCIWCSHFFPLIQSACCLALNRLNPRQRLFKVRTLMIIWWENFRFLGTESEQDTLDCCPVQNASPNPFFQHIQIDFRYLNVNFCDFSFFF